MIDEIIKELHYKHNIEKDKVEAAVMSQFVFLRDLIASGDMESVRLPKLGLFIVKPHRRVAYEHWIETVDEDQRYGIFRGDSAGLETEHVAEQGDGGGSQQKS